ncbi:hypothetical protein R1flu_011494 [Riccia fluitans]|uniref:ORM1-like protein 3 n=1 Tax=Riccia fluitans TaxID=41844 RepID=A0ABD1ZC73_9MARC
MAEGVVHRVGSARRDLDGGVPGVGNLYVKVVPPPDLNKNTEWFLYPGVWTTYLLIIVIGWLLIMSVFRCSAGTAWTVVNLLHFAVTYRFFHWKKGSPFAEDQGMYNKLTWWEQVDHGRQLTRNRKFLTVVPVVLYLIASHTTDYKSPVLLLNTIAVFVLLIAKFPHMHKQQNLPLYYSVACQADVSQQHFLAQEPQLRR